MQKRTWKILYGDSNILRLNGIMTGCTLNISGQDNKIIIDRRTFLRNVSIIVHGNNNTIILKDGVTFNENGRILIEDNNNNLHIDSRTQIQGAFIAIRDNGTSVHIGKECLFSSGVVIRSSDAHSILDTDGKRINPGADVTIGNHVWLGFNTTILKGTTIGDGSVIGSNATVASSDIASGSLAVGIPARVVKSNISWDINRLPCE